MVNVSVKGKINASADDVWKTFSSFRDVEKYFPLIKSSTVQGFGLGTKRTCTIGTHDNGDAKIEEEITKFDNDSKSLTYSIISSPLPFQNYLGTVKVIDLGDNTCEFECIGSFEPKGVSEDEASKQLKDVYLVLIDGLNKFLSS